MAATWYLRDRLKYAVEVFNYSNSLPPSVVSALTGKVFIRYQNAMDAIWRMNPSNVNYSEWLRYIRAYQELLAEVQLRAAFKTLE